MTAAQHTIVYAVRHGETQLNRDGRLQGTADAGLTPKGAVQIEQAAAGLVDTGVMRIICSPLLRSRQSAEILARCLRLPIMIDDRLTERSFGELEGALISLLTHSRPHLVHRIQGDPAFAPPGGESEFAVTTRARDFLRDLVSAPDRASPVVLVGHGGWLSIAVRRVLYGHTSMLDSHTSMLGNGQISTFVLTPLRSLRSALLPVSKPTGITHFTHGRITDGAHHNLQGPRRSALQP